MSSLDGAIDIATALLHSLETSRRTEQELQRQISEGLERESRLQAELASSRDQLAVLELRIDDVQTQRDNLIKQVEHKQVRGSSKDTILWRCTLQFVEPETLHGLSQVSRSMASFAHDESIWADVLKYPAIVCDPHNFKASFVSTQASNRIQSLREKVRLQERKAILDEKKVQYVQSELRYVQWQLSDMRLERTDTSTLTWTIRASRLHDKWVRSPDILPGVYFGYYPQGDGKSAGYAGLYITMPNQGDEVDVEVSIGGTPIGTLKHYFGKKTKNSSWGFSNAGPKICPSKPARDVNVVFVFNYLRYDSLNFTPWGEMAD